MSKALSEEESAGKVVLTCSNCKKKETRSFNCSAVKLHSFLGDCIVLRCQMYPSHSGLHQSVLGSTDELFEWAACECSPQGDALKGCDIDSTRHQAPMTKREVEKLMQESYSLVLCDACASGIGTRHG